MKKLVSAISKKEKDMDCWIDYYYTLGFDIVIYDDNDTPIIYSNKTKKIYKNTNNIKNNKQILFYNYILQTYKDYDWIALFDCDEYLVYDNNKSLDSILSQYQDFSSVCVNWLFFGSNGHKTKPEGRVFENFTKRQSDESKNIPHHPCRHVKSIVQPNLYVRMNSPHSICGIKPSVSSNMDIMPDSTNSHLCPIPTDHTLWLNHYFVKSKEHWEDKLARGYSSFHNNNRKENDWYAYDMNDTFDDRCSKLYNKLRSDK